MSRSYKKNPICSDRPNGAKYWKRIGNKKTRRSKDNFPKGKKYRRLYNSWEIHDFISRWGKEEALEYYNHAGYFYNGKWYRAFDFKDEKEFLNKHWKKYYRRK